MSAKHMHKNVREYLEKLSKLGDIPEGNALSDIRKTIIGEDIVNEDDESLYNTFCLVCERRVSLGTRCKANNGSSVVGDYHAHLPTIYLHMTKAHWGGMTQEYVLNCLADIDKYCDHTDELDKRNAECVYQRMRWKPSFIYKGKFYVDCDLPGNYWATFDELDKDVRERCLHIARNLVILFRDL